eukprot:TRINITY_DN6653_c1_g1_i1.p1 TRINITY_DN6653_c1_g1~~TRINITY_DN6653_c1_g1_i1.p1  ORF type:complete len:348 (+),score=95.77 TRINITY_DN6653_c1_g1_i1:24-1046(+)
MDAAVHALAEWCGESPPQRDALCLHLRLATAVGGSACLAWWTASVAVYSLRMVSPAFAAATAYGKLRSGSRLRAGVVRRGHAFHFFYVWAAMWCTTALALRAAAGGADEFGCSFARSPTPLATGLFFVHAARRAFESAFVHRFTHDEKVEALSVIAGLGYYFIAPVTFADADLGPLRLQVSELPQWLPLSVGDFVTARRTVRDPEPLWEGVAAGLILYVLGSLLQSWHHYVLAQLRKDQPTLAARLFKRDRSDSPAPRVHSVPTGGLFQWLVCPHYVAEVILYVGMCLVSCGGRLADATPATAAMMAFVCLNLGHSAYSQREWYWRELKVRRWVLIPYLL